MTKAQEVFDKVEELVATGVKKADAFRQVADELGQPFNSIRGAYYTHTRSIGGTPGAARRRSTSTVDPVEQARAVLEEAIEMIDHEITAAKERVDEAKAEYDELRATAAERKARLQEKFDALAN
jgi:chromosome segregation ATPase